MLSKIKNKILKLNENNRIVLSNIFGAFVVKGGALVVSVFTMPAYIAFFNNETVLGVWYTILSVINWILHFDFGIGNGLRNHLTTALVNRDEKSIKKYISSAYTALGVICVVLGAISTIILLCVNWNVVLKIDSVSSKALVTSMIIVLWGIIFQLFLRNISSVLYAMQKSSVNNFLSLCTTVSTLILVLILPSGSNDKNIIVMAVVHSLAVNIPLLIATIVVFCGRFRSYKPSFKWFDSAHAKQVLTLGSQFLFAQLAYMVIMSTNEILINTTSGGESVVEYQAYYRIFTLASTVFTLMLTPLWSAITKAITEKQSEWVRGIFKKFCFIALLGSVGELALVTVIKPIITLWLNNEFAERVSYVSALYMAIIGCLMMFNGVLSSVSNGTGKLKTQIICFVIGAVCKIPLSILLTHLMDSWNGVLVANIVCMGIYTAVQPFTLKKELKEIGIVFH